jgi:hypothetical protein
VSAADVRRGFSVRASDRAVAQSVKNSAFLLLFRSVALPAQSFQLPFEILQMPGLGFQRVRYAHQAGGELLRNFRAERPEHAATA